MIHLRVLVCIVPLLCKILYYIMYLAVLVVRGFATPLVTGTCKEPELQRFDRQG